MKFYKICTRKKVNIQGRQEVLWFKAGVIRENERGTKFLTLFNNPETEYFVLEPDEDNLPEIQLER